MCIARSVPHIVFIDSFIFQKMSFFELTGDDFTMEQNVDCLMIELDSAVIRAATFI